MQVGVWAIFSVGHVVIDDNIDSFYINTTAKDVSGNHDALIEILEALISCNSDDCFFKNEGRGEEEGGIIAVSFECDW